MRLSLMMGDELAQSTTRRSILEVFKGCCITSFHWGMSKLDVYQKSHHNVTYENYEIHYNIDELRSNGCLK